MQAVKIIVDCYWTRNSHTPEKYSGGYNIKSCIGYPEINGGFGTPDFGSWTIQDVADTIKNTYKDYYRVKDKQLAVEVNVTKDERVTQSLDSFF